MSDAGGRMMAALLILAVAACGQPARRPAARRLVVTDDAGRSVSLPAPARRVVSLVPSINETLIALGAADRAIARSDYDHAPELARLPSIGGGLTPNIEWLAARRPDLVFSWPDQRSRAVVARLEAVGIPVYAARIETLEQSYRTTLNVGRLLGLDSAAAALVARQRAELAEIARKAAAEPPPRVLYLIGLDPPEVAGGGTFVDELLHIAGGTNVFADLPLWPNVSAEEALRRNPDVIAVAMWGGNGDVVQRLRSSPGWSGLRAVRAGRVFALDPDLSNRPGPRAVEAAELLFRALHPRIAVERAGDGRGWTADGAGAESRDGSVAAERLRANASVGNPEVAVAAARRQPDLPPTRSATPAPTGRP